MRFRYRAKIVATWRAYLILSAIQVWVKKLDIWLDHKANAAYDANREAFFKSFPTSENKGEVW